MPRILLFPAFIIFFSPLSALADAPQFSDYPVIETMQGFNHPPTQEIHEKDISPELQEALKTQNPNFANHYIIYTKSCGKNCIAPFIADIKTGENIEKFPQYYMHDKQHIPFEMQYQLNSRLLILSGISKSLWEYPTQTYWIINKGKIDRLTGYFPFHKIEYYQTNFKKYCQDLNIGKKFDGTSDFLCIYPHKTIKAIYQQLLNNPEDKHFLSKPLPKPGKKKGYAYKNDGDSTDVYYEYLSSHNLRITLDQWSVGRTTYNITQEKNKTTVRIHTEKKHYNESTAYISPPQ